jgi:hypothetical protein
MRSTTNGEQAMQLLDDPEGPSSQTHTEQAKHLDQPIGVYGQSTYGHCRSPTREELAKSADRSGQPVAPHHSIEKSEA